MPTVHALRPKHQVGKRQRKQRAHLGARPVVTGREFRALVYLTPAPSALGRGSALSLWRGGSHQTLLGRNRGRGCELLHLGGAILEFRDLAERIERRIGEQIGGCFHEGERN